jgi:uncharacterized protein YukE
MNWELLGGDPAPGDGAGILEIARSFRTLQGTAEAAATGLRSAGAALGEDVWKGPASNAFRARMETLPADLDKVSNSFSLAAAALNGYTEHLAGLQQEARSALASAEDATANAAAATAERARADQQRSSIAASIRAVQTSLARLRAEILLQMANPDPSIHLSLQNQQAEKLHELTRLEREVSDLDHAVRTASARLESANAELDRARARAGSLRQLREEFAHSVAASLRSAHDVGIHASLAVQFLKGAHEWIQEYGPVIAAALDELQQVCALLALIPTPLSGILAGAALALAVSSCLIKLSDGEYGNPPHALFAFTRDALFAASGVSKLSTFARVSLTGGGDLANIGDDLLQASDGKMSVGDARKDILWTMAGAAAPVIVTGGVRHLNRDPAIARRLDTMATSMANGQGALQDRNFSVSLLTTGQRSGGQYFSGGARILSAENVVGETFLKVHDLQDLPGAVDGAEDAVRQSGHSASRAPVRPTAEVVDVVLPESPR